MNFPEAEAYLLSLGNEVAAMKLGLESIRTLLSALGDPQNNYLKVQVAGTNGKGSVCAFIDSICRAAGIEVGLYTSPHLISITERIKNNGDDISEGEFARLATQVRQTAESLVASGTLPWVPTFFEQVTAIALLAFAEAKIDLAILETGLGGRLDATTAANAEICAITRIDLDHQEYLGETIEEIAAEKAAIITENTDEVAIGEQELAVKRILEERCKAHFIEPITGCGELDWSLRRGTTLGQAKLDTNLISYRECKLGLWGDHQLENAQVAVSVCQALKFSSTLEVGEDAEFDDAVFLGLQAAHHPGRLEYEDRYLFDGAHNVGGAKALVAYLNEFESRPITLLFGAMADKPIEEMLAELVTAAERVVFTQPSNERSLHYDALLAAMPAGVTKERTFVTDSVAKALDIAETITPEGGIILVTGSLYLVGEVKRLQQQATRNLKSGI
ncbi:MAG: bifunctional folylpolyglutamate synthase/dihydrofolate synthase [Pyrinomonadaceae bacterium]